MAAGGRPLLRLRCLVPRTPTAGHGPEQADRPPVRLTALELKLLEALMIDPGRVLPSDTLIAAVWGPEGGDRAMLKQLVYRLRAKIEDETTGGYIETVPGIGYALARNDE